MESKTIAKNGNKPLKAFRLEDVSLGVFANDRDIKGENVTFYNVSISKTYMKDGKLQRTQTFASSDIGKLRYLLEQAEEFVAVERGKAATARILK